MTLRTTPLRMGSKNDLCLDDGNWVVSCPFGFVRLAVAGEGRILDCILAGGLHGAKAKSRSSICDYEATFLDGTRSASYTLRTHFTDGRSDHLARWGASDCGQRIPAEMLRAGSACSNARGASRLAAVRSVRPNSLPQRLSPRSARICSNQSSSWSTWSIRCGKTSNRAFMPDVMIRRRKGQAIRPTIAWLLLETRRSTSRMPDCGSDSSPA